MRKWKPLANPRDQSAWYSVTQMYPTVLGTYRSFPGFNLQSNPALATPGSVLRVVDFGGTYGVPVVATSTKLWVSTLGWVTFADRSPAGYTGATSLAMFGKIMLANGGATLFSRDASGVANFAAVAGSPNCTIMVVQSNAVLAYGTTAVTSGDDWAASDVGNYANWTPGAGSEAVASTQIAHRPGVIVDAIPFQDYVLVFKGSSIYRHRYVGGTIKWSVELIADGVGLASRGAVVSTGQQVYFWDSSGPKVFDGATVRSISPFLEVGGGSPLGNTPTIGFFNAQEQGVLWGYSSGSGDYLYYSVAQDAWGRFSAYKSDGTKLSAAILVEKQGKAASADFLNNGGEIFDVATGYYVSSHIVAPSGITSRVQTTAYGDETRLSDISRIIPVLSNAGAVLNSDQSTTLASTDLNCNVRSAANPFYLGGTLPSGVTSFASNPIASSNAQIRFDLTLSARWIDCEIYSSGKFFEIEDVMVVRTLGALD